MSFILFRLPSALNPQLILLPLLCVLTFAQHANAKEYKSALHRFNLEVLVEHQAWGFDWLSPKEMVLTERRGVIKVLNIETKKEYEVTGVPKVLEEGHGGLLDIRVHEGKKIFFVFTEKAEQEGKSVVTLASAEIDGTILKDFKRIYSTSPGDSLFQAGSRIEFQGKRYLFLSLGERDERKRVQDPETDFGKIFRFDLETNEKPEMWAKGLRNPQGLAFDAQNNLWESELGPMGGDEINIIEKGNNYGWSIATYGLAYTGKVIGPPTAEGVTPAIAYWTPSISPSGITFYYGNKFPRWNGNMFVCTLSGKHLRRLEIKNKKVVTQEVLLASEDWRFRNARTGPDGLLYVSTETKIIRLSPLKPGTHQKRNKKQ